MSDDDRDDDEVDGVEETFAGTTGPADWIAESLDLHPVDHPASKFLGKEFLLWLWWSSEKRFGSIELGDYGQVDFWIDDRLKFQTVGEEADGGRATSDMKGGAPATTREAKFALAAGKIVEVATLGFRLKEREYSLTISGESLELAGVKVPGEVDDGIDELILERMFLLEEIHGIVAQLFYRFADERLGKTWNTKLMPEIRQWIAEGA